MTIDGSLADAVVDRANLRSAWQRVLDNDAEDDWLAPSVRRFAASADEQLDGLAATLADGTYRPRGLTEVEIPKSNGEVRRLHVPAVVDRVVERALAQVVSPLLDPDFSPWSFAYRPGLGVTDAIRALVALREEGYRWVVRTDIHDCFPNIGRVRLLDLVDRFIGDAWVKDLVGLLLARPVNTRHGRRWPDRGLPQGSPLSPLLANLYLDQLDRELMARGVQMIRFADDITLVAADRTEAERLLAIARDVTGRYGMVLGTDKTEVVSFEEGFAFLGKEATSTFPPASIEDRRLETTRRTLYVGRQGAGVRIDRGRVVVGHDDAELVSAPASHVGRVVLFGSVGLSAGARSWAMGQGVEVVFLSRRGSLQGWLQSATMPNVTLRRAQYEATGAVEWCIGMSRRFVFGKLTNQRSLLLRYGRREHHEIVPAIADEIAAVRSQLGDAMTVAEVMGLEGIAARRYYAALANLLPDELDFAGRSRQPPGDVVNAGLSYGYAILCGEAVSACVAAGLDPVAGFLHSDDERRVSLALDLIEEFRPLVVDAVVIEQFRRGTLDMSHARVETGRPGVLLTEAGRRHLIAGIEDRLLTVAHHVPSDQRASYRRAIHLQAAQIARGIRGGEIDYRPVTWRCGSSSPTT